MKKLLAVIFTGIMVLSLVACGGPKGEKLNMVAEAKGMGEGAVYSADIYYEPVETVEVSSSYANRQEFLDETQNIDIEFRLCSDSTYGNNKKIDAEEEGFREFKVGEFDAYAYHYSDNCQKVYVFLDGSAESSEQARYMVITVEPYEKFGEETGEMVLEKKYVQNIINSITYNGLILPGAETEAE